MLAVVSLVIGIGIFKTPADVAKATGSSSLFFSAWAIGGLVALIGGLVFAEIGSRRPTAGGYYKVVSEAYHPVLAFMLNWMAILVAGSSSAAVCIIGAEYILPYIPWFEGEGATKVLGLSIMLGLFGINFLGIRMGASVLNVLTVIKILMIAGFSVLAFSVEPTFSDTAPTDASTSIFSALSVGLIAVFFTFGGYHNTINMGGDVIKPRRNLPLGIITGIGIVFVLYMMINFSYVSVLGVDNLANSKLVGADLAKAFFGSSGQRIISLGIFISVLGFLNANMLQYPRVYHAMAEDKVFPPLFSKVNPKTQVQQYGLIFYTGLTLIFILFQGTFSEILKYVIFNDTLVLAIVASTLFILRMRDGKKPESKPFKLPGYPVLPAIFCGFLLMVSFRSFYEMEDFWKAGFSLLGILAGYPLYFLIKRYYSKSS